MDDFDTFLANQQARVLTFLATREDIYNRRMRDLRYEQGKKPCKTHELFDCPICEVGEETAKQHVWAFTSDTTDGKSAWIDPKWEMESRK